MRPSSSTDCLGLNCLRLSLKRSSSCSLASTFTASIGWTRGIRKFLVADTALREAGSLFLLYFYRERVIERARGSRVVGNRSCRDE